MFGIKLFGVNISVVKVVKNEVLYEIRRNSKIVKHKIVIKIRRS